MGGRLVFVVGVKILQYLRMPGMTRKKNIHHSKKILSVCSCGVEAPGDTFTWADLGGHMVLLCWACTDKLHKNTLEKEVLQ
tara:strand:+ start:291 stop:533 length:243 start_codon:yes stop_codon:yes gene_type:complete